MIDRDAPGSVEQGFTFSDVRDLISFSLDPDHTTRVF